MPDRKIVLVTSGTLVAGLLAIVASAAMWSAARAQVVKQPVLSGLQVTGLQKMSGQFLLESGLDSQALHVAAAAAIVGTSPEDRRERAKLQEILRPAPRIQLALDSAVPTKARMTLQEGGVRVGAPATGQSVSVLTATGLQSGYTFSQHLDGAALLQVIVGRGLRQERRFTLDSAGSLLTVEVRVTGARLSAPALVRATYRRG